MIWDRNLFPQIWFQLHGHAKGSSAEHHQQTMFGIPRHLSSLSSTVRRDRSFTSSLCNYGS